MADDQADIKRGHSSAVSPLVSELFAADSRKVGPGLAAKGNYLPKPRQVDMRRYYDPAFAELEKEKLWKKVWQFACREEDIPQVGDRVPYNVGELSYFIVRVGADRFKAFHNACLHRGTRLCDGQGGGKTVRCPFHAWEWNLDGSVCNIPSRWDFPSVTNDGYRLPEAKLATWGGFIFINPDPDAGPLEDALGVLPAHFADAPCEDRFTAFHIRKLVRANWKTVMEAFLEAYHVIETHTDAMPFTGDASTQYDCWESPASHISRLITPLGIPSPHLGDAASIAAAADATFQVFALGMPGVTPPRYDPASPLSPRAQVAAWRRQMMAAGLGRDFSSWPDAALLDSVEYHMFPNFCPWYADGLPLTYQFLPYGSDPNESVMNIRFLVPLPGGGAPRPPSAPIIQLGFDDSFHAARDIGLVALIFDQDMSNLPRVQAGMKAAAPGFDRLTLGRYQEQRITYFHEVLDRLLGLPAQ